MLKNTHEKHLVSYNTIDFTFIACHYQAVGTLDEATYEVDEITCPDCLESFLAYQVWIGYNQKGEPIQINEKGYATEWSI